MRLIRLATAAVVLLTGGCTAPGLDTVAGVGTTGVRDGREAPTGLAPGVTLYFVDAHGRLRPDLRDTGRLGTVGEALALLLTGPGEDSRLHTEIDDVGVTRVRVTTSGDLIQLGLPLAFNEVTDAGIDQIVCTAIGVHVQSGNSRKTQVQTSFVIGPETQNRMRRTCPLQ